MEGLGKNDVVVGLEGEGGALVGGESEELL